MILAIDIGNSNVVLGAFEKAELKFISRISTDIDKTADEISVMINEIFTIRGIDRATDVLSFPFNELRPGAFDASVCERDPESGRLLLGDMMISLERCAAQGEEFTHGFEREIRYLTVHSVLHLLGYDHVDEGRMKKQMRAREKEIMGDKDE